MHYFFLIENGHFCDKIVPTLAAAWSAQTFASVLKLCREKGSDSGSFSQLPPDSFLFEIANRSAAGVQPFHRGLWRRLVGEILLSSASEMPEIETPLETFAVMLGEQLAEMRENFSPIQQSIFGSRDLVFGSYYYRPEFAGWNDSTDVQRLANWLSQVQPDQWSADLLTGDDPEDDLLFAQEWFPALVEMYRRAAERDYVVIGEQL